MGLVFHQSLAIAQGLSPEQYLLQRITYAALQSEDKQGYYGINHDTVSDADVGPSNITGEYFSWAMTEEKD